MSFLDIFADPALSRAADIERRLRALEGTAALARQRGSNAHTSTVTFPSTFLRLGLAPVHVAVPYDSNSVRLSGSVSLTVTDIGTNGARYVEVALFNLYRSDDVLYAPLVTYRLNTPNVGTYSRELLYYSVFQTRFQGGDYTFGIDLRSRVIGAGTPATAVLNSATLAVEVG